MDVLQAVPLFVAFLAGLVFVSIIRRVTKPEDDRAERRRDRFG